MSQSNQPAITTEMKARANYRVLRDGIVIGSVFKEPAAAGWVGYTEIDGRSKVVTEMHLKATVKLVAAAYEALIAPPSTEEPARPASAVTWLKTGASCWTVSRDGVVLGDIFRQPGATGWYGEAKYDGHSASVWAFGRAESRDELVKAFDGLVAAHPAPKPAPAPKAAKPTDGTPAAPRASEEELFNANGVRVVVIRGAAPFYRTFVGDEQRGEDVRAGADWRTVKASVLAAAKQLAGIA